MTYDLVFKNGHVADPEAGHIFEADVAISQGRIARIAPNIDSTGATTTVDASRAIVCPGFIDLHTHVFTARGPTRVDADTIGVEQGVAAVVDAGSFGPANGQEFLEKVVALSKTRVFGFINVSLHGINHDPGEASVQDWLSSDTVVSFARDHLDWIRGVKTRASASAVGSLDTAAVRAAKEAALGLGVPLMVHVGNAPPRLEDVCEFLEAGDIITHCFHGKSGGVITKGGAVLPAIRRAVERGVYLDIGHGAGSFSFETAGKALGLGLRFHTISTDLHRSSFEGSVKSLTLTMTKLLHLGVILEDIIKAVTLNPAKVLSVEDDYGRMAEGAPANLSIISIEDRALEMVDSYGNARTAERVIVPRYTVLAGQLYPVELELNSWRRSPI
jgi:dihydroorotase